MPSAPVFFQQIESVDRVAGVDDDAGLFKDFAFSRLLESFTESDLATGNGP